MNSLTESLTTDVRQPTGLYTNAAARPESTQGYGVEFDRAEALDAGHLDGDRLDGDRLDDALDDALDGDRLDAGGRADALDAASGGCGSRGTAIGR